MRVWVTRAEPGAGRTAEALAALGHHPVVRPLLTVRPVGAQIDLSEVKALAFTSRNGVGAFSAASADRTLPVFAVGDATAAAAREAGFSAVASADGDAGDLALLIASAAPGLVLHAGAAEPAQDLAALLAARGIEARGVVVYETIVASPVDLDPSAIDAVLVHSPKAARALATWIGERKDVSHLIALAISGAAAAPLGEVQFRQLAAAPFPNEASLLKLLTQ